MDQLNKLGFVESANITFTSELKINIFRHGDATNILYAFILADAEDIADWNVLYIGHTRKSLKNRMYGYQRGNGKGVNNRLHELIKSYVKDHNKIVKVYCFVDNLNLVVQGIDLDLAAGLEYSLINYYADYNANYNHPPLINIAGNKNYSNTEASEDLIRNEKEEEDFNYGLQDEQVPYKSPETFSYSLNKTYWDYPYLNIPAKLSKCFGENGETAVFNFYKKNSLMRSITVLINRNAVKNGSPRFYLTGTDGKWFQEWKYQNFKKGDSINVSIISKNHLLFDC